MALEGKRDVIELIEAMPDDVTVRDIMAELYFKLQVEAGLKELEDGNGIPHEVVEKRLSRWLSK